MFDNHSREVTDSDGFAHLIREITAVREQLRIANLIALAAYTNDGPYDDHALGDIAHDAIQALTGVERAETRDWDGTPDEHDFFILQAPIADALGIGLPQPRTDINTAPDPTWEDHEAVWRRNHPQKRKDNSDA